MTSDETSRRNDVTDTAAIVQESDLSLHNLTGADDGGETGTPALVEVVVVGGLVSIVIIAIVVGNAFVVASVAAFREMRTLTNWMIVSLASADLLVAVAVLPLSGYQEVVGGQWRLGRILCDFWTTADVFCCTASILNIAAIALDRYWLITRNVAYTHAHRLPRPRACRLMAGFAWSAAAVISVAPLLGWRTGEENDPEAGICHISQDYTYTIFSTFGAFWLPLTVIVIVYGRIFWIAQRRLHRRIRQRLTALPPPPGPTSTACPPSPPSARCRSQTPDRLPPETADNDPRPDGGGSRASPTVLLSVPKLQTRTESGSDVAGCRPLSDVAAATKLETGETSFLQVPATKTSVSVRPEITAVAANDQGGHGLTLSPSDAGRPDCQGRTRNDTVRNHLVSYRKCQYKRMRNSARMLGLIIGGFVLCWLPFFILATAIPFCGDACNIPGAVASVCNWLGYANSLLNPVIYAIWDRNFRRCFRRLATCELGPGTGGIATAAGRGLPGTAAAALRRSEPF